MNKFRKYQNADKRKYPHKHPDGYRYRKAKTQPTQLTELGIKPYPMIETEFGDVKLDEQRATFAQCYNYDIEHGTDYEEEPIPEGEYPLPLPDDFWKNLNHDRFGFTWRDRRIYGLWAYIGGLGWMTEDEYEKFMLHPDIGEDPGIGKPMLLLSPEDQEVWLNQSNWDELKRERKEAEKKDLKKTQEAERQATRRLSERAAKETLLTRGEDEGVF